MKHHLHLSVLFVFIISLVCFSRAEAQSPLGTGFTYQGYLAIDGTPADGKCDFQFSLWDALSSGAQVGSTLPKGSVLVTDGVFTVTLDFGAEAFIGENRWLEVAVRCPAGTGSYTTLSPRQELSAAPYALYSLDADKLDGQQASAFWNLSGNAGTTPGTNFIGTNDNQALEIRVNGQRVMLMEPNATSPNILGGYYGNWITSGVSGSVISGGGDNLNNNRVTDNFGVIAGGRNNQAGDGDPSAMDNQYPTIGGGFSNIASVTGATVAGGINNTAGDEYATISGGKSNSTSGISSTISGGESNIGSKDYSTIGGGKLNRIDGNGYSASICGGYNNHASGDNATISGGYSIIASGNSSVVSGGYQNQSAGNVATIAGGWQNEASGNYSFVGGGYLNNTSGEFSFAAGRRAKANHQGSFVWADSMNADFTSTAINQFAVRASGGVVFDIGNGNGLRLIPDATSPNIINGYSGNALTSGIVGAVIGGGGTSGSENHITDNYGIVGGGVNNWAGDNAGTLNDGRFATVGGGESNYATGVQSTIGGGVENEAHGNRSSICGGYNNEASGNDSTISGGTSNTAYGIYANVSGGYQNSANGDYSFAAGRRAKALYSGCFVWGDSYNNDVTCTTDNRWLARAQGGVYFYTNSALSAGSYLAAGSGTWNSISDRAMKENFNAVQPVEILEKVAAMPLSTWNYISEDSSIRHMGPMAQDFHAAFGLGDSEKAIGTIDADGVALASIQALYTKMQVLQAEINALKAGRSTPVSVNTSGFSLPWLLFGGLVLLNTGYLIGRKLSAPPGLRPPLSKERSVAPNAKHLERGRREK